MNLYPCFSSFFLALVENLVDKRLGIEAALEAAFQLDFTHMQPQDDSCRLATEAVTSKFSLSGSPETKVGKSLFMLELLNHQYIFCLVLCSLGRSGKIREISRQEEQVPKGQLPRVPAQAGQDRPGG